MFDGVYEGKRVLVTGSTGFKGVYLSCFLQKLKAEVLGIALPMPELSLYNICRKEKSFSTLFCDIREKEKLEKILKEFQPEIVFHLAAQSLVKKSYTEPVETFSTNIMGTVNILECCRKCESIRSIIVISSDKCYENRETFTACKESDPMGGYDPYSASKGCTEIVTSAYRRSFFPIEEYGKSHHVLLGSCRAGNVIGGGDYAENRLIPDLVRGTLEERETILRNPASIRPWQHVFEPLSGYLALGAKLYSGEKDFAEGWNFGPGADQNISVGMASLLLQKYWDKVRIKEVQEKTLQHEAGLLFLDSSKAGEKLQWKSTWNIEKTFQMTAQWYSSYHEKGINLLEEQLQEYIFDAQKENILWSIK
ncbi:MAG: CDP-glucose 4,6-dehydratase [Lentisphaeria bacterium]|nr:CDP-glucose 4,6-dehydratase [Lentisphaeria bacterium]